MGEVMEKAGLKVGPLEGARFGGVIQGVTPQALSEEQKTVILQAYRARSGLLCFEFDEMLSEDDLHALTALFGEQEFAPGLINGIGRKALPGEEHLTVEEQVAALRAKGRDPYMMYLGNVDPQTLERQNVSDKFFGEWEWHTDMSYIETPPTFSLLHARIVPQDGGNTGFCSQILAAKALSPALRDRVSSLMIKHDSTYLSSGIIRPGMTAPASPIEALGYPHPILRKTPGGDALYLGRRTNAYVVGLPLEESEALLDELWEIATREAFQYHHAWTPGQVVAWDNRMLLHLRHAFDPEQTRFMWRTQTKGEAVIPA